MALTGAINELNTGSSVSTTANIRTKRFDFGSPEKQKRFSKVHIVYKSSSSVTINIYMDAGFILESPDATITFPSQTNLNPVSKMFSSVGKTIEIKIQTTASDFELESIDFEYDILGSNP